MTIVKRIKEIIMFYLEKSQLYVIKQKIIEELEEVMKFKSIFEENYKYKNKIKNIMKVKNNEKRKEI